MHIEDSNTVIQVREVNIYLPVKTSCPEQCLVKNVSTVCCSKDDNAAVCAETVHLGKELVEGIFTLVVSSHVRIASTCASNCVNLIDKYDTGSFLFSLAEKVTHSRCTYANKHFNEITAAH